MHMVLIPRARQGKEKGKFEAVETGKEEARGRKPVLY